jgi:hypothetical protein
MSCTATTPRAVAAALSRCPPCASRLCAGIGCGRRTLGPRRGSGGRKSDYFFTTRNGRPVEQRNVYRSFTRVAQSVGLRVIRLHDVR